MLTARDWLFVALGAFTLLLFVAWFQSKDRAPGIPSIFELFLGMITNFFDTLGIGSFAPTASIFKFRRMVPDEKIPGTLNVGHALPTLLEAAGITKQLAILIGIAFVGVLLAVADRLSGGQERK